MRDAVYAIYDLETVANDRAAAYYAQRTYDAPANYRDPEKIAAAIREKRQADMERAALHWWTGKVVCASVTVVGGEQPTRNFISRDERSLLISIFDWFWWLEDFYDQILLSGKSSEYFDIPFLVGRALSHDLGILDCLRPRYPITDVDKVFSASSHCDQRTNLANYAWGLGIAGKTAHGSDVATIWFDILQGDLSAGKRLVDYCAQDNAIAVEMLTRWLKPYSPSESPIKSTKPDPTTIDEIPFG